MKKRFTEEQIIGILREADAGLTVKELIRKHGIAEATYYAWKANYDSLFQRGIPTLLWPTKLLLQLTHLPMNPNQLSDHIAATYQAIRIGLAIIAFLFPPWLVFGGKIFANLDWQESMSHYYHASALSKADAEFKKYDTANASSALYHQAITLAMQQYSRDLEVSRQTAMTAGKLEEATALQSERNRIMEKLKTGGSAASSAQPAYPEEGTMRNWFVGLLFALGIILYLYKGFTWLENWALNTAGVMGLGVALFPMAWGADFPGNQFHFLGLEFSLHGACAFTLFIGIAYVCIYRAPDTLLLIKDKARQERYRKYYRLLGHMMWGFPVIAWVLSSTLTQHRNLIFLAEMLGVWIFGAYWWVKSREIAETNADKKALCNQLNVPVHGAADFNKAIPIAE